MLKVCHKIIILYICYYYGQLIDKRYQSRSVPQRWSLQQVEEFALQVRFMQHEVAEQQKLANSCEEFLHIYEVTCVSSIIHNHLMHIPIIGNFEVSCYSSKS